MKGRVEWLDGLRGLSCIMIFTAHFFLGFFPATQFGTPSHGVFHWDEWLSVAPIRCIFEGRFWVGLFCLISGYVICLQVVRSKKKVNPLLFAIKRYFRLTPPVFILSVVVWLMLLFDLFSHFACAEITGSEWLTTSYVGPVPFTDVLKEALLLVWIEPHVAFSNAFWVLPVFFLGSFLAYGVGILTRLWEKRSLTSAVIIAAGGALLFFFQQYYYLMVLLGAVLAAAIEKKKAEEKGFPLPVCILLIILGVVIASFPSNSCLGNSPAYYSAALFLSRYTENVHETAYLAGGFLVFFGLMRCDLFRKGLSKKLFQKLNEISYAVYLIHIPLIFSLSCFLFCRIYEGIHNYQVTALLVYVISLAVLILLSKLCTKYIEKPLYGFLKKLVDK